MTRKFKSHPENPKKTRNHKIQRGNFLRSLSIVMANYKPQVTENTNNFVMLMYFRNCVKSSEASKTSEKEKANKKLEESR